jgi:hypothetical protein
MLDSAATGKRLPEKNLLILGAEVPPGAELCWFALLMELTSSRRYPRKPEGIPRDVYRRYIGSQLIE